MKDLTISYIVNKVDVNSWIEDFEITQEEILKPETLRDVADNEWFEYEFRLEDKILYRGHSHETPLCYAEEIILTMLDNLEIKYDKKEKVVIE